MDQVFRSKATCSFNEAFYDASESTQSLCNHGVGNNSMYDNKLYTTVTTLKILYQFDIWWVNHSDLNLSQRIGKGVSDVNELPWTLRWNPRVETRPLSPSHSPSQSIPHMQKMYDHWQIISYVVWIALMEFPYVACLMYDFVSPTDGVHMYGEALWINRIKTMSWYEIRRTVKRRRNVF